MPSYNSTCQQIITSMGVNNITCTSSSGNTNYEFLAFDCMNAGFNTHFFMAINESANQVSISSRPQWAMPRDKFGPTLLYIILLNYQLAIGSVDIDMDDGEVRFKTTATFGTASNIKPILTNFMNFHVDFGKRYLQGFAAIKNHNASAETAMEVAGVNTGSSASEGTDVADAILRLLLMSTS